MTGLEYEVSENQSEDFTIKQGMFGTASEYDGKWTSELASITVMFLVIVIGSDSKYVY